MLDGYFQGAPIPAPDGEADMVCFFSVLTHLLHEESYVYLQDARRVLKPTGKLVRIRRVDLDAFLESGATIKGDA